MHVVDLRPLMRPSDVGFCAIDSNADAIASKLIWDMSEKHAAEIRQAMNRLYRARGCVAITGTDRSALEALAYDLDYLARMATQILETQDALPFTEAAE